MGFLKRFANSRIGAGSGDIILEEKDVPEHIKREKQALKYTREGYLDVGKSDLSLLSKPTSQAVSSPSLPSPHSPHSGNDHLRLISSRLEDNSTDIYKLMQRIELLERKIERIERIEGKTSSATSLESTPADNAPVSFPGGLPF
jgi:hypothetical protein